MTTRVVVADDHEVVRKGFRMILEAESDIAVVGEAADGSEALDVVRSVRPDVVLMDIRMPNMDGVEATRRLTGEGGIKVLILTTFDLDDYVVEGLRAGAAGFLLKDVPAETLVEGIRIVSRGDALLAPSVTRRLLDRFVPRLAPGRTGQQQALATLTDREHDVLVLVARGLSNAEIAERLFLSETTVKTHVSHALMKLGLRDRVQAVVVAYETGLVQPGVD